MPAVPPSRAIIDLDAYAHNLRVVRRYAGRQPGIVAVVKADAYGHGAAPIAWAALAAGAQWLGVATMDEGVALREAGIAAPILVLFQPHREALAAALEYDLLVTICDTGAAEALGDLAQRAEKVASVHCMIDTGMNRQGFPMAVATEKLQVLTRISHLDIQGVCTHFPVADRLDDDFTHEQLRRFRRVLRQIEQAGIPFEQAHAAHSAALMNYPGALFDLVRPGLMTYGVWPCEGTPEPGLLRPVLRWETHVTQVKTLEAGESIGYGRTFTTDRPMDIAVLPVGYADGYPRSLSNKAEVLIRGLRCPVRGTVCMDQVVVDVSQVPRVQPGDTAVLIGSDGSEQITASELARHAGTIPYEILVNVGRRVVREYRSAAAAREPIARAG